ncbi:MAG: hypothetical protein HY329_03295 [Chloroflexi bacterium]|nr:hypothetical protein [Chloroflexota bacterium]
MNRWCQSCRYFDDGRYSPICQKCKFFGKVEKQIPVRSLPNPAAVNPDEAPTYDEPFEGFRRWHFNDRQYARLLVLRGKVQDALVWGGTLADDVARSH